ncbi:ArdC-like ssDNA-binding domain-containing protein [Enterococcus olivae]
MSKKQTQKEIIDELMAGMNESIKQYKNDPLEELKLLAFMNRFNNYSVRNIALIQKQFGESAIGVASYKQHQQNGHQVQKGEKAIRILAPKFQKMFQDEKTHEWKFLSLATAEQKAKIKTGKMKVADRLVGFLSVPVFDITQTNCPEEDYPKLYPNKPETFSFDGSKEDVERIKKVLVEFAEEKDIEITFDKTNSTAKGYFVPATNDIVIKDSMDEVEQVKVLLHELAHAEMHNLAKLATKTDSEVATSVLEYQAEMTAYIVSSTLGIDSEDYSKKYLANWTKRNVDDEVYIKSLEEVKQVASSFITTVANRFDKLSLGIPEIELEAFVSALNDFSEREFGTNQTSEKIMHTIEKNGYHADLVYTEEEDSTNTLQFSKQVSYDLKNKTQINSLSNEFITLEAVYPYGIEDCTSDLMNCRFDDFFDTTSSFKLSIDDVTNMIKLTALTEDTQYLDKFVAENKFDVVHLDLEHMYKIKNDLLKNLDTETIEFFQAFDVAIPDDFIFDHEFKNIISFQLSPYETYEENGYGEILYTKDTIRQNGTETFTNYKDLWEKHFKDELGSDLDSSSLKELQQNRYLAKSPTLLNRLARLDTNIATTLASLKEQNRRVRELDLDNDGVPDRIDPDDTRSVIRTEADKTLVGNRTDKYHEVEQQRKPTRTRSLKNNR